MTYKQAYDKIIDAYFKDEIKPLHPCFCFCGTLCDGEIGWCRSPLDNHYDYKNYTGYEYVRLEKALIHTMRIIRDEVACFNLLYMEKTNPVAYEHALFDGMCAALDVLKQIHIERGEVIDEVPVFTKRELA